MHQLFFEVLAAPDYEPEALALLQQKKNRILLQLKPGAVFRPVRQAKRLLNGILEQDADSVSENREQFTTVTQSVPSEQELTDLEFAIKAVKHLKSNGIALVKQQQLIGMGCGQTSRVDALQSAIKKAREFGFDVRGAVMASEAFFHSRIVCS
ncbi:MAG: hypothetical protein U0T84_06930 [Chitinophagales bacterium]